MNKITPNNDSNNASSVAPRPYDTQLADDRVDITKYNFTPFDESIAQCFQRYKHPLICNSNKTDFFIMLDMDGTIIDTTDLEHSNIDALVAGGHISPHKPTKSVKTITEPKD